MCCLIAGALWIILVNIRKIVENDFIITKVFINFFRGLFDLDLDVDLNLRYIFIFDLCFGVFLFDVLFVRNSNCKGKRRDQTQLFTYGFWFFNLSTYIPYHAISFSRFCYNHSKRIFEPKIFCEPKIFWSVVGFILIA